MKGKHGFLYSVQWFMDGLCIEIGNCNIVYPFMLEDYSILRGAVALD